MAVLEIAKNVWWGKLSREEQEEYLRTHKRSKLKITKRRKRSKKDNDADTKEDDQPEEEPKEEAPAEGEPDSVVRDEDIPAADVDAESVDELKQIEDSEPVEDLQPAELDAAEEVLKELAPAIEPAKVLDEMSEEHKQELEDEIEDAVKEKDGPTRASKFAKAAFRLALRTGVLTAAVVLVGTASPASLFLPQVYGSIWSGSDRMSRSTTDFLSTGLKVLHKTLQNGARRHVKKAVRKEKGSKRNG